MSPKKTSRRDFVLNGGATLGAGVAVAATAGAMALPAGDPANTPTERMDDVEAIRRVHAEYLAAVEDGARLPAVESHRAYRSNARQREDIIEFSTDRRHATASWHVDVHTITPVAGDSTIAQMARLQGNGVVRWEAGKLLAKYERFRGNWSLTEVGYRAS